MMIINTIIDHYHNIKINTKGNLIIAPVTRALQLNHLQFYPPNIFFSLSSSFCDLIS